jgi:hypothetical protein
MNSRENGTLLLHAFAGWLLCAATMGIGMAATSAGKALIIHAIGAPVYFSAVSFHYFSKTRKFTPFQTAAAFVVFVVFVDFFFVALLINRSLDMFRSALGTWIPFGLIFSSTYLTGCRMSRYRRKRDSDQDGGSERPET